jgi:hypothetical protein
MRRLPGPRRHDRIAWQAAPGGGLGRHRPSSSGPLACDTALAGPAGLAYGSRGRESATQWSPGWHVQLQDFPAHARRPSATAQPAILSATTPSSHQAPHSVLAASPTNTAIALGQLLVGQFVADPAALGGRGDQPALAQAGQVVGQVGPAGAELGCHLHETKPVCMVRRQPLPGPALAHRISEPGVTGAPLVMELPAPACP